MLSESFFQHLFCVGTHLLSTPPEAASADPNCEHKVLPASVGIPLSFCPKIQTP